MPSPSFSPFFFLFFFFCWLVVGDETHVWVFPDAGDGTAYPFEVPTYNEGFVTASHVFSEEENEAINSIKLCITWQIPPQVDAECDFSALLTPTEESVHLSVRMGVSYFLPIINFTDGYEHINVNLTLSILMCSKNFGGVGCQFQVNVSDYDDPVSLFGGNNESNPFFLLFPTTPGYTSFTFASSFVLDINSSGLYDISISFASYDQDEYYIKNTTGSLSTSIPIYAPPLSRSPFVFYPEYWVVEILYVDEITLSASLHFCEESDKMSDKGAPCTISTVTFQPTIGVPQQYNIGKNEVKYFSLFESSSVNLASYNAILALGVDNPPANVALGDMATCYNVQFRDNFRSVILRVVAENATEPVYLWGTNSGSPSCPLDCNGVCNPGEYLCECSDGSFSISCSDPPSTPPPFLLIFGGSVGGVVVGVGVGVVVVWRKRKKEESQMLSS